MWTAAIIACWFLAVFVASVLVRGADRQERCREPLPARPGDYSRAEEDRLDHLENCTRGR